MRSPAYLGAVLLLAAAPLGADAHAMMSVPKPNAGGYNNSPAFTISGPKVLPAGGFDYNQGPEKNYPEYTKNFKASNYKTLRDLIAANAPGNPAGKSICGIHGGPGTPQELPAQVEWQGFSGSPSHVGPCEVWCDDTLAFHDDNCVVNYADGKLPYDKSKCVGKKQLQSIWLALHVGDWQVYPYCATLSGSGGSDNSGSNPAPAPGPAPTTRTPTVRPTPPSNAPPAATPAPAPDADDDEDCDDDLPEPDADCDDDLPEPDCDDDLPEPGDDAAGDADCDDDLPEPDCDDDLPEPDADCDDDLPEPDCDDDLPEPEYGGESDVKTSDINFDTYKQRSADEAPGRVYPENF